MLMAELILVVRWLICWSNSMALEQLSKVIGDRVSVFANRSQSILCHIGFRWGEYVWKIKVIY